MAKTKNAARVVSSAMLGLDLQTAAVAGKTYVLRPPTIKRLCGAAHHLSAFTELKNMEQMLTSHTALRGAAAALSWLIDGSDALTGELMDGTPHELAEAIAAAVGMLSTRDFLTLSVSAVNVAGLTAKQKQ